LQKTSTKHQQKFGVALAKGLYCCNAFIFKFPQWASSFARKFSEESVDKIQTEFSEVVKNL